MRLFAIDAVAKYREDPRFLLIYCCFCSSSSSCSSIAVLTRSTTTTEMTSERPSSPFNPSRSTCYHDAFVLCLFVSCCSPPFGFSGFPSRAGVDGFFSQFVLALYYSRRFHARSSNWPAWRARAMCKCLCHREREKEREDEERMKTKSSSLKRSRLFRQSTLGNCGVKISTAEIGASI